MSKFGWWLTCYDILDASLTFRFISYTIMEKMVKMLKHGMPNSSELSNLGCTESYQPQIGTMHRIRSRQGPNEAVSARTGQNCPIWLDSRHFNPYSPLNDWEGGIEGLSCFLLLTIFSSTLKSLKGGILADFFSLDPISNQANVRTCTRHVRVWPLVWTVWFIFI